MAEEDVGGYYSVLRLKIDEESFKRGQQKAKEYSHTINQTLNDQRTYNQFNYTVNNYNRQARENASRITSASASYASAYRALGESLKAFSGGNLMGGASSFARFAEQLGKVKQAQNQKTTYTTNAKGQIVPVSQAGAGGGNAAGAGSMRGLLGGAAGGAIAVAAVAAVAVIVAGVMGKKIVDMAAKETVETTAAKYSNLSVGAYSALNAVGTASGVGRNALQGSMASLDQKYQAIKTGNVDTEMIKSIAMLGVSFHRTRYMDSAQRYTTIMNAALRMRDERLAGLLVSNVLGEAGAKQFYFTKQTGIGFGQQMSDARHSVFTTGASKYYSAQTAYSGGMLGSAIGSMMSYGGAQLGRGVTPTVKALFDLITNHKSEIQSFLRTVGDLIRFSLSGVTNIIKAFDWWATSVNNVKKALFSTLVNSPLHGFMFQLFKARTFFADILGYFQGVKHTNFGEWLGGLGKTLESLGDKFRSAFDLKSIFKEATKWFDVDRYKRQAELTKELMATPSLVSGEQLGSTLGGWHTTDVNRMLDLSQGYQSEMDKRQKLLKQVQNQAWDISGAYNKALETYTDTGKLSETKKALAPVIQDLLSNSLQQQLAIEKGALTGELSVAAIKRSLAIFPKEWLDLSDLKGSQNITSRVNEGKGGEHTIKVDFGGLGTLSAKYNPKTGQYENVNWVITK